MKKSAMLVLLGCLLAIIGVGLSAEAAAEETFGFPVSKDTVIVAAPVLPAGYVQWENVSNECKLKDGRILGGKVYKKTYIKDGLDYEERLFVYGLDGKDVLYFHVAVGGSWQEITGETYFFVNGKWGEFKINGPMKYLHATEYLVPKIKKSYAINDSDLDGCQ